jgi:serine/threonine-protein kinase
LGFVLGIGLGTLAYTTSARAEPDAQTRAAAVALFDDARKKMAEGNYADACPKLEQSQRMDPGIGTLFNLADCYEHIGRTASAWLGFRDVAGAARAAQQPEREKVARDRAAALEPKLSRLSIEVAKGAPAGLEVTRDGKPVPRELWGTALPLDPGEHELRAAAEGFEPWSSKIRVEGKGRTVTVNVPALAPRSTPAPAPLAAPPPAPAPSTPPAAEPPPPTADQPAGTWRAPLGLAMAGLGVVGLGAGTVFGFVAKSTFDDSDPYCDVDNDCEQAGVDLRSDAVSKGNVGTALFIAGGVLATGGLVLWLTAPSSGDAAAPATVGITPQGVLVRGSF